AARHASALNGFLITAQAVQLITYAFQRVASAIAQRLHLLLGAGDRTFQLAQIALVQQRERLAQPAGFAAEALERNSAALIAVHQILKRQLLLKILLLNLLALPDLFGCPTGEGITQPVVQLALGVSHILAQPCQRR